GVGWAGERAVGGPAGASIVTAGAVVSVLAVVCTRPDCRVPAGTPMSANRFTVACRIRLSTVDVLVAKAWSSSSPHGHCTVPAPNTRAPLVWSRYRVSEWASVPGP